MANETVNLKIQRKAPNGEIGTFLIDTTRDRLISPVFDGLYAFYLWAAANGWRAEENSLACLRYVRQA